MTWVDIFASSGAAVASRNELIGAGATGAGLTAAVKAGHLLRLRRDHYALPHLSPHAAQAVRIGGRLACISALRDLEVFGFDHLTAHVHVERDASRLRSPRSSRHPLAAGNRGGVQLHWWPLGDPEGGTKLRVSVIDALAQAIRCQHPWHALASIESALHLGVITSGDVAEIFRLVPAKYQYLRHQIDPRSEAGQETVLRRAFIEAGLPVEIQVWIDGVGRVDFLIAGRLIVEADSRQAHDGWEMHVRDRDRDIDAARQGYMSLRPAYKRIMFTTSEVVEAVVALLAATELRSTL